MSKEDILEKLKEVLIDLDDEKTDSLITEALEVGLSPMDILSDGLSPGLTIIGEGYEKKKRFLSDLVIAGEIMSDAVERLRHLIEAGGQSLGKTMVIGSVEGDLHTIGKRIVGAIFTGAGYRVIDIGENMPASAFVEAAKEYNAAIVGASAVIGPVKVYCEVINKALISAGIRDKVIYIIGGWGMTQDWSDRVGADAFGKNAFDALNKVKMIQAGEPPRN